MANFNKAHKFTARWEGGYVNDPDDPGGATNYGVSLRWLKSLGLDQGDIDHDGDIDANDIRALSAEQAAALFREKFWDAYHLDDFPQALATIYYDAIVNTGASQATKFMQRGYNSTFPSAALSVDGILGPLTRNALQSMGKNVFLLRACIDERDAFYRNLAASKPSMGKFLKGWLNRTHDLRTFVGVA